MRNEIPKLGWIRANFRFEQSRRGLKGPLTRKGVLTAHCGRNLDAGQDDPTNRCLRLDESALIARIHALGVDGDITPQQAEEWISKAKPHLKNHVVTGACWEHAGKDRKHVYSSEGRRCGGVMIVQQII